jgi:uncharacterized protein (TIGR03435 family)
MAWTKSKTAAVVGVAVLLAAGTAVIVMKLMRPVDYSWEVKNPTGSSLGDAQPQLTILPAKFTKMRSWSLHWSQDGKALGINVAPKEMIECAFRTIDGTRTIVNAHLPKGRFDFICNLSHGASNAFCKAVQAKFGVTASHQTITTNVFILSVNNPNAPGLKPARDGDPKPAPNKPGHHASNSESMRLLIRWLRGRVHVPVLDQTGLKGNFAYSLDWDEPDANNPNDEGLKQALIDQLGLELKPDIQPVEMLVIEKAR